MDSEVSPRTYGPFYSKDEQIGSLKAQVAQLTKERDEWARKWHAMRKQYAELKYPGMTGVILPLSAGASGE